MRTKILAGVFVQRIVVEQFKSYVRLILFYSCCVIVQNLADGLALIGSVFANFSYSGPFNRKQLLIWLEMLIDFPANLGIDIVKHLLPFIHLLLSLIFQQPFAIGQNLVLFE